MHRHLRVAVLRCRNLPRFVTWEIPNVEDLFVDDRMVLEEFAKRGVEASSVVWQDPAVDWNRFDLALIRSTWDYVDEREPFLDRMAEIEASSCRLFNPLGAVRWNSDKRYLLDLRDRGVPTVPTYEASTTTRGNWRDAADREGWRRAVLKPVIGTGGQSVRRIQSGEIAATLESLVTEEPGQEFLVQPFVESVADEGEWSFIYIEGELGHVLLKKPAAGDYRAHGIYGGSIRAAEPDFRDAEQAREILAKLPFDLLYARLDLVRVGGRLSVMELELIEPILYCNLAPHTAGRLAEAAIARAAKPR